MATELSFQNRSADKRRIYWIDQDGDRKFYGIVEPGNAFRQPTLAGHAWVVTDDAEKCLYAFVASAEPRAVDVGEAAAAMVAPPPPGAQQPIAQAPVAPPAQQMVAPPPREAVQTPPPPPPPVAAAAPPQQVAADPLPQISPVEQFQLSGIQRLGSRIDPSKFLNNPPPSGTIDVAAAKPDWDSAQWTFEAVRGTPFVRIKNKWKGTYLADFNGKPRAMPGAPDATETHWTFEPVDGTDFVQFRNRETDGFLVNINGAAAVVASFGQELENNSHWRVVAQSSRPVAAVAPRNQAYDLASADCREIGGFWTGSSCRRPAYIAEPLSCRRGFQWSEAAGECEWVGGGSCPPWQMGPGGSCRRDLVCRGGDVEISGNGRQACYCPRGTVAWGDYPYLSCVPSVSRVAPYLIPAVAGAVVLGIISGGKDRPQVGPVFGNKKFCGPGQTGTPPNCVAAQACKPPLVGTPPNCLRAFPVVQKTPVVAPVVNTNNPTIPVVTPTNTPGIVATPTPTPKSTPTSGAAAVCSNNEFLNSGCRCELPMRPTADGRCFATPSAGQACLDGQNMSGGCQCLQQKYTIAGGGTVCASRAPSALNTVCQIGETIDGAGNCVKLNASITCTGGRIEQGVCGCPTGTTLQGSGTNFQCVAAARTGINTSKVCQIGETKDAAGNCVKLNASITCTGGRIEQGVCGCPSGTTLQGNGTNFQCVAAAAPSGIRVAPSPTPTPTPTPTSTGRPGTTVAPSPTPTPTATPTAAPKPVATPTPTTTPKPVATPSPTPTVAPKPTPTPTAMPKPVVTPSPTPTSVPKPVVTPSPKPTPTVQPRLAPPPPPKPVVTPPPPPPKPVTPPPPPPKPVVVAPPKPPTPPACAPPKKLNPAGQCV